MYGQDSRVEDALAEVETQASRVLNSIIVSGNLPPRGSANDIVLRTHIVLQAERTMYSAEETNEMIGKFVMAIMEKHPRFKEEMKKVTIGIKDPALFRLGMAGEFIPFTLDLEIKLLLNRTGKPFITSDNPIVKYNQLLEARDWPGSHCGWAVKGLQTMLPLNASNHLIMYDSLRYRIGNRRQDTIEIIDTRDVDALNGLQFLNAGENVYFGTGVDERYIREMHGSSVTRRRKQKVNLRKFRRVAPSPDPNSMLLAVGARDIRTNLVLSFCKMTKHAKQERLGPSAALYRSEKLRLMHESMRQADIEAARAARAQRDAKPQGESTV
jgi:hypothetical protein